MRQTLLAIIAWHALIALSWADCAWVLVEEKHYPDQTLSEPYASVMPHRYFESLKDCEKGEETALSVAELTVGYEVIRKMRTVVHKDSHGKEAYYRYECIPSNVLALYVKAER